MAFAEILQKYMNMLSLNAGELASAASISASTVSRCLNRIVIPNDRTIRKLASALSEQFDSEDPAFSTESIYRALSEAASGIEINYEDCVINLKELLELLNVTNNELARNLSYDPSYISRIRSGSRKPANLPQFLSSVSDYIARRYFDTAYDDSIRSLIGADAKAENANEFSMMIQTWLGRSSRSKPSQIAHFLTQLDEFDLNEFMASIHFQEMKIPSVPFQFPTSKTYTGIPDMMQAELDFIKSAVLSKSDKDVIFYSDMPMEEMAADPDFPKKWMYGLALLLRKGLHIQNIHNVHRPLSEMLLGLESWIPMYMTGQVSPYYFREPTNQVFLHFIRSAGTVAIAGEAVYGKHGDGRYIVTRNREDVAYYRKRAEEMVHRALPLMDIYRSSQRDAFQKKMAEIRTQACTCRRICSAPPLFTMSEELLERMIRRNELSTVFAKHIRMLHDTERRYADEQLMQSVYALELPLIDNVYLMEHPIRLPVSELFPEQDICYTAEEYQQHIQETKVFAEQNEWFSVSFNSYAAFRNIDITVRFGTCVLVSKSNLPAIHFLIYHPKMIEAFEQFIPPIIETEEDA